jgi:hypothetical protein
MLNRQNGINFFPHLSEVGKFIIGIKLEKMGEIAPDRKYGAVDKRMGDVAVAAGCAAHKLSRLFCRTGTRANVQCAAANGERPFA